MSSDDSSDLSSVPSEVDDDIGLTKKDGILKFFSKVPKASTAPPRVQDSPPRQKREPSPPHEYVLADNPDIAFIVMFRSRFNDAFPKSLINFGPQELERDIVDTIPGEGAEHFLCALLGLLLNRKQDVKAGHYNRALEEAVQTHKSQWARDWESKNPLSGGATFTTMSPTQRLTLLRTLILWSLSSSDVVKGIITASYKQSRHEDDLNQPLSVQPWGMDGDKRRYFLVEGIDDTHFRVYRESAYTGIKRTWWSVAGDIEELQHLAEKLATEDGGQKARNMSGKMLAAVPRFEATEEKRKRREYRQARKQAFKRPEGNYSLYEGRTRGKRMKYTYSDDEDVYGSDFTSSRRSTRTGTHTPAEGLAPTTTLSGRQVKPRHGGAYGESIPSGAHNTVISIGGYDGTSEEPEIEPNAGGRPRRAAAPKSTGWVSKGGRHIDGYNSVDEMSDDDEDDASEQDYGDDEDEDDEVVVESDIDEPDDVTDEEDPEMMEGLEGEKRSLVVKLPVKTPTPEKERIVKLRLTPEEPSQSTATGTASANHVQADSNNSTSNVASYTPLAPSVIHDQASYVNSARNRVGSITASAVDLTIANPKSNTQPQSSPRPVYSMAPQSPAGSTEPIDIAKPALGPGHQSPMSPSLAFRGSPEKPQGFPPSINVGHMGS